MVRPGIVDLRDLISRRAWDPRLLPQLVETLGLAVEPDVTRSFAPPRVLVLVVPLEPPPFMAAVRPWIAEAERVVILRDGRGTQATVDDPELVELLGLEWQQLLDPLPNLIGIFDWSSDAAPCRAAIARACEAAAELAPGIATPDLAPASEPTAELAPRIATAVPARPATAVPARPVIELPTSAWVAFDTDTTYLRERRFAAQLAVRDERAVLVTDPDGGLVDLAVPPARVRVVDAGNATLPPQRTSTLSPLRAHVRLGFDPEHPVGWRGHRMAFYWSYVTRDAVCYLSANDHDFPCGPAKKLWGHRDNDPVQVALAPAADAYLARFEHDVLVTDAVPIPWQRAGAVDVATFEPDPRRAVFFAQEDTPHPPHHDLLDEDARHRAPAAVLGPSAAVRYAIDLRHRVYRITYAATRGDGREAVVHELGGPAAGYAAFDADHGLVRHGAGHLLGGWFRWATIEDDGRYWREDLATGERTYVGRVDDRVCTDPDDEAIARDAIREGRHDVAWEIHARYAHIQVPMEDAVVLAIPGTRNILIVADGYFRIV